MKKQCGLSIQGGITQLEKEVLTLATTQMNLEDVMLSEIYQSQVGSVLYDSTI